MAKPHIVRPQQKKEDSQRRLQFSMVSRLAKAVAKEFNLQSIFKLGYRNKEDISNLPAYTLVVGSQNVLTNAAERVGVRNGYTLDGPAGNQNTFGIDSSYDFLTKTGVIQNLRKWGGNLEMRYANPVTSVVTWVSVMSTLLSNKVANFTNFFDSQNEQSMFVLFVNGDNRVYEWTGAVGSFASATSTTLTISGTQTLAQIGFYNSAFNAGKMQFLLNGVTYTYTSAGVSSSTAFTGSGTTADVITPTIWWAQKFTTGGSAQAITEIDMSIHWDPSSPWGSGQVGTVNFYGQLYTDNAGVPGTKVGGVVNASNFVSNNSGNLGGTIFNFKSIAPEGVAVSPATNYHFVVFSDQTQFLSIQRDTNSGQNTLTSTNSGSSWSASNGPLHIIVTENDIAPQTFLGVTPDPTSVSNTVGDPVIQNIQVGATINGIKSMSANYPSLDLISTLDNQVWYGCVTNNTIFVSKIGDYGDVSFSTPRIPSEGALMVVDAPPVGFSPQAEQMYVFAGTSQIWVSDKFTQSITVSTTATQIELLFLVRLKTATNQGAQTQGLIGRFKNSIVYVSNEQIINAVGLVKNVFTEPQVINMSDPIKYDIDAYNFLGTGGQLLYDNYFIYVSVPANGIVRMYNVQKKYWEAPQTIPVGRFYHVTNVVGNVIYGHSYLTNESYEMFVGFNDNGNPINAIAAFPYVSQEGGEASQKKNFNKFYTEGYIAGNTQLTLTINYDFGGFSGNYSTIINGANSRILFNRVTDGSLGQSPLGSQPVGSILNLPSTPAQPKFRIISTFPRVNCFEYQIVYSSNDVDQNWELLRIGPAVVPSTDIPVEITI